MEEKDKRGQTHIIESKKENEKNKYGIRLAYNKHLYHHFTRQNNVKFINILKLYY